MYETELSGVAAAGAAADAAADDVGPVGAARGGGGGVTAVDPSVTDQSISSPRSPQSAK